MTINLSEKIKALRKEKGISQEKLADYLGVSFQAVSKWENDNTCPDISLLPEIARFFGITVDELLQVEKLNEKELYSDYERRRRTVPHRKKHRSVGSMAGSLQKDAQQYTGERDAHVHLL